MNDRHSHARAWLAKAVSDLTAAQRLLESTGPYDAVCFHAQQACEKALKAVLAMALVQIPRTHNLEELLAECEGVLEPGLLSSLSDLDLSELTPYAVEARYDAEFWPDAAAAESAVQIASRVVEAAREVSGRPPAGGRDDGA